jgi:hypothetical protein
VIALTIPVAVRCWSSAALTEPRSADAVVCTTCSWTVAVPSATSCWVVRPACTATPLTVFG